MPEPVARRYREGEQTIAQEHQDVTVIFADIVGLDEISAKRKPLAWNRFARYTTDTWPAAA
ncbi:hypothetical protein PICSAR26_04634 [Mycobacterium avium subsp. paratuberculosis]|nr:hypothetical protein PICSAR26_04634 [Mycobacterium avium subsp. paratuberculosis]